MSSTKWRIVPSSILLYRRFIIPKMGTNIEDKFPKPPTRQVCVIRTF